MILSVVLIIVALVVSYISRGPSFPTISAKAGVDSTKDNIVIEVYSGSIPANEWEYRLTQSQGTGDWVIGGVALEMSSVNLENKATTPGTWYVSLRHRASGHEYFSDQSVTVE